MTDIVGLYGEGLMKHVAHNQQSAKSNSVGSYIHFNHKGMLLDVHYTDIQDFQKGGGTKLKLAPPSHPTQNSKTPRISATLFFDFDYLFLICWKYIYCQKKFIKG